jgi:hypothetical protein
MSQEKHSDAVTETTKAPEAQINTARRRLTRAALAGPVVLGTLASKQALANSTIPYQCTISGQISGTASARPGDGVDCHTLGRSPGFWQNHTACWGITGIGANGQMVQGPYVFFSSIFGGSLNVPMGNIIKNCYNNQLARAAIASYLNAYHFHTNDPAYPLSTTDVVNLYNNNASGNVYPGCDLKCYFESLYSDSDSWPAGYSPANCPSNPNGYTCS